MVRDHTASYFLSNDEKKMGKDRFRPLESDRQMDTDSHRGEQNKQQRIFSGLHRYFHPQYCNLKRVKFVTINNTWGTEDNLTKNKKPGSVSGSKSSSQLWNLSPGERGFSPWENVTKWQEHGSFPEAQFLLKFLSSNVWC